MRLCCSYATKPGFIAEAHIEQIAIAFLACNKCIPALPMKIDYTPNILREIVPNPLKTNAAISNAHLSRVCKRGKLSGSCLSTLKGFGSTQLPIFLCHIGVPTFSS